MSEDFVPLTLLAPLRGVARGRCVLLPEGVAGESEPLASVVSKGSRNIPLVERGPWGTSTMFLNAGGVVRRGDWSPHSFHDMSRVVSMAPIS